MSPDLHAVVVVGRVPGNGHPYLIYLRFFGRNR